MVDKKPLKELERELDPNIFWRIHRAAIVNISFVVSASRTIDGRYELQLMDQKSTLTASRAYAHQFKQM
ncbi:MAG: LytTR family transcriptional regulator [Gammaproteobacteria bacterium]|nr:LytTR family transcriptional regulator [Gammaproteobacteria bacterium]